MTTNTIDPSEFPDNHPLSAAMRLTGRYWFLAYSKLMSMKWVWTEDPSIPYGATNGNTLFLNRKGLDKLCRQPKAVGLIAFLLAHEGLHALLGHCWRVAPMRNKEKANVAADYVANALIAMRNREVGREVFTFIEGVLLNEDLSGDKSVEKLYRELNQPQAQPDPTPQPQPQPQDDEQDSEQDSEQADEQAGESSDSSDSSDDAGDSDSDGAGSGDDGSGGTGGDSGGGPSDGQGEGDNDLSDFVGKGGGDALEPEAEEGKTIEETISQIEEDNERILVADAIDRRTSGEGGAGGQRVRDQRVSSSSLDWCDLTREWLLKHKREGWMSPFNHVVYTSTGLVCAGRRSRAAGTVVLALDSSGSIGSATYTKFLQQAQAVLDELKPEQLVLLSVSHLVADSVILTEGDRVPNHLNGGGGTRFSPAFKWLEAHDIQPDVMIYLTDGWSFDLRQLQQPDFPLLWLSTSRNRAEFPVGEVLEITDF
jgi:predicted metal-dependent peptidase